jgi:hypothetical protein
VPLPMPERLVFRSSSRHEFTDYESYVLTTNFPSLGRVRSGSQPSAIRRVSRGAETQRFGVYRTRKTNLCGMNSRIGTPEHNALGTLSGPWRLGGASSAPASLASKLIRANLSNNTQSVVAGGNLNSRNGCLLTRLPRLLDSLLLPRLTEKGILSL